MKFAPIMFAAAAAACGSNENSSANHSAETSASSVADDSSGGSTATATTDPEPPTSSETSTTGGETSTTGGETSTTGGEPVTVDPKWLRGFGDGSDQRGTAVVAAPDGSVLLVGFVEGIFYMDQVMVTAPGRSILLAKLSPEGVVLWAQTFPYDGDVSGSMAPGLELLDNGDILLGGTFLELDLGAGPIARVGQEPYEDIFVARFDASGALLWSRNFGGEGQWLRNLALDAQGNILLSGRFWGTLSFGGPPIVSPPKDQDPFVVKLSGTGDLVWNKTFHVDSMFSGLKGHSCVAESDAQGNIYVAGDSFVGELDLGGMKLVSEGAISDKYLVKYDPDGTAMWARNFPKQGVDGFVGGDRLVVHDDGTAWLGGNIYIDPSASIDFGGGAVAGSCGATICTFLGAIDADGQTMHALTLAGSDELSMYSMTSDRAGGVVLAGYFGGTVTLGPQQLVSDYLLADKGKDKYIARVDASGVPLWAKALVTSDGFGGIADVSADSAQRVAVTGVFWGDTLTLDPLSIPLSVMSGKSDLFVAQVGPTD